MLTFRRVCACVSRATDLSTSGRDGLKTRRKPEFGEFTAVTQKGGCPSATFLLLQEKGDPGAVGKSHILSPDGDPLSGWWNHKREAVRWQLLETESWPSLRDGKMTLRERRSKVELVS